MSTTKISFHIIDSMFTNPRFNVYESSDGFSVEVLGFTGLCYREGAKQMFVDSEMGTGPSELSIRKSSIERWDQPHENEPVTDADRARIVENIRAAFRFQGYEIGVV